MNIGYLYSKFFKKYILGKSIYKCVLDKTSRVGPGANVRYTIIGKYSYCGPFCVINHAVIGSFCSISDNVYIGAEEHPMEWVSTSQAFHDVGHLKKIARLEMPPVKNTYVGNDVWIGHGAFIKQGINIGDGAIVAACSVVTKDVPPYAIVGGIPAKIIKYRFDDETIHKLLESRWWTLEDDVLKKMSSYFRNPILFIEMLKKTKENDL